jgi:hypothetical protein
MIIHIHLIIILLSTQKFTPLDLRTHSRLERYLVLDVKFSNNNLLSHSLMETKRSRLDLEREF